MTTATATSLPSSRWPSRSFPIAGRRWSGRSTSALRRGLLLDLAYFSLKIFTKTSGHPTPQTLIRNRVYRVCGALILVCVLLIGLYKSFGEASEIALVRPVFWLETIALWSFGFSWFVKGETLWRDK